ncbi:hypothetical protein Dimus_013155 [Dionaea muscipula]
MSVIHLKKKDVVKSKVRGVKIQFDHEKLATILGIPGNNGICEYVKDVWEESKYIKPLEITKSGENRRRDDDVDAQEGESEEAEGRTRGDFDWEAVEEDAEVEGNMARERSFMMSRMRIKVLRKYRRDSATTPQSSARQKEKALRSRPLESYCEIHEVEMTKLLS